MRRLAHLSDLHFGTTDPGLVSALARDVGEFEPQLTIVTGDVTQRAKPWQFREAREFLDSIASPRLVIPGNHDIAPLYTPWSRLFDPYRRYRKYFGEPLETTYVDEEVLVIGINSVQPLRWKEGHITRRQLEWIATQTQASRVRVRILAVHHPIVHIESDGRVRHSSAQPLLRILDELGIDLVLMGHLHQSFNGIATSALSASDSLLLVQASTATSSRLRGHLNGYNRIILNPPALSIEQRVWNGGEFRSAESNQFERMPLNWRKLSQASLPRRESA